MEQLQYDVYYGADRVAALSVSQEGLLTRYACICPRISDAVLRLYGFSGGREIPLGVMLPEGNVLRYDRRFSKNALSELGIGALSHGVIKSAAADPAAGPEPPRPPAPEREVSARRKNETLQWLPEYEPAAVFRDPDLISACKGVTGALKAQRGRDLLLAIPLLRDAPFPMMPIFCFGHSEKIAGKNYVVFQTRDGVLK